MKNPLIQSPLKLFVYATAFRFSSGQGRCFSPGIKAMSKYYVERLKLKLINKEAYKFILFKLGRF